MYNYAGSWLFEVGMTAKSGVGGGIIAVLPGRFGIGVFSFQDDSSTGLRWTTPQPDTAGLSRT
jgi:glutaminase